MIGEDCTNEQQHCLHRTNRRLILFPSTYALCRNEGEVEIALLVVEEEQEDLDKAVKRLSELIDGKPSRVLAAKKFFESSVTGELKTTFFILKKLGKEAELTNDVILLRFLGLMPGRAETRERSSAQSEEIRCSLAASYR